MATDSWGKRAVHDRALGRQQGYARHHRGQPQGDSGHSQPGRIRCGRSRRPRSSPVARGAAARSQPKHDVEVDTASQDERRSIAATSLEAASSRKANRASKPHPGIPVLVVDEEIYHRPPSMMIATVDKFAMMAWRGEVGLSSDEPIPNARATAFFGRTPIAPARTVLIKRAAKYDSQEHHARSGPLT